MYAYSAHVVVAAEHRHGHACRSAPAVVDMVETFAEFQCHYGTSAVAPCLDVDDAMAVLMQMQMQTVEMAPYACVDEHDQNVADRDIAMGQPGQARVMEQIVASRYEQQQTDCYECVVGVAVDVAVRIVDIVDIRSGVAAAYAVASIPAVVRIRMHDMDPPVQCEHESMNMDHGYRHRDTAASDPIACVVAEIDAAVGVER